MIKILWVTILLFCMFPNYMEAQDEIISEIGIAQKISFLKKGFKTRKIDLNNNLFFDFKSEKQISPVEFDKDSLRHFLVCNGFYDYNFEHFRLELKNAEQLNDKYIEANNPMLYNFMLDSSYNKITYCHKIEENQYIIDIIMSKNFIEIDDEKRFRGEIGTGYYKEEITIKGQSNIKDYYVNRTNQYSNIKSFSLKSNNPVVSDTINRFEFTFDVSSHKPLFAVFKKGTGHILSIVKIY